MFGAGSPVWYPPQAVHAAIIRAMRSPDNAWIPINPVPQQVKDPRNLQHWSKVFPKAGAETMLPARKDLEELVDTYFGMGHWDFAFVLCAIVYWGSPIVPSMDNFVWEGPPGASRLWVLRGKIMIPVPNGPVKTALETWWALSGGHLNLHRNMLPIDLMAFDAHFRSIDSPIILTLPWGSDDPEFVLDRLKSMHVNEVTYPSAPVFSHADFEDLSERWGCYWSRGTIVDTIKLEPRPRQEREACVEGPLGLNWINAAKDTIPERIFARACSLRENGYARV